MGNKGVNAANADAGGVFTLHTRPTPIQSRAFELLAVNPDRTQ